MATEKKSTQDQFGFDKSDESDDNEEETAECVNVASSSSAKSSYVTPRPQRAAIKHRTEHDDEYNFDSFLKKTKLEQSPRLKNIKVPRTRLLNSRDKGKIYTHKWGSDEEDDLDDNRGEGTYPSDDKKLHVRFVHKPEISDEKDLEDDLTYFMDTLESSASTKLKLLSLSKLVRKCAQFAFRQYIRAKPQSVEKLVELGRGLISSQTAAMLMATFFYMFSRDKAQFHNSRAAMTLLCELLKMEKIGQSVEFAEAKEDVWETLTQWKAECDRRKQKDVVFDLHKDYITPGGITVVSLDYIVSKCPTSNKALQLSLLELGFLQNLIAKVDKNVLCLKMSTNVKDDQVMYYLSELEHAYRILENAIVLDKKNQEFVVGHRNGSLLFSSEKFLDFFCHEVKLRERNGPCSKQLFNVLCLVFRALMNATHGNDLCAMKLGQVGNFLQNSLQVLCDVSPRLAPEDRALDVRLLLCGLLINMTEKCAANRKKATTLKVANFDPSQPSVNQRIGVLAALGKNFALHEGNAKSVDEELDNELMEEVPTDAPDEEEDDLERVRAALNNDHMVNMLNSAMSKATIHMHDSMIASYLALLVGCLVQTDEDLARQVKDNVPSGNLEGMVEQLDRFQEFAQLTKVVDVRCIDTIIQSLKLVNS